MDSHYIGATLGAVDVKITHSTQGIAVEVDCKRPREPGESAAAAVRTSVEQAIAAYQEVVAELKKLGLEPGPHKKAVP